MGLARGNFHSPGGIGKESAPSINGACSAISSTLCIESVSTCLLLSSLFTVRSLAKSGGIATAVLLAESSTF